MQVKKCEVSQFGGMPYQYFIIKHAKYIPVGFPVRFFAQSKHVYNAFIIKSKTYFNGCHGKL